MQNNHEYSNCRRTLPRLIGTDLSARRFAFFARRLVMIPALAVAAICGISPALASPAELRIADLSARLATTSLAWCENAEPDGKVRPCADQVTVARSRRYNAWFRGDRISVSRRLVEVSSDDELAFVIAHEMAHIILGHPRSSPKRELEADQLGARIARQSGFNPRASSRVFARLEGQRLLGFPFSLFTHPSGGRRTASVERALGEDVRLAYAPTDPQLQ